MLEQCKSKSGGRLFFFFTSRLHMLIQKRPLSKRIMNTASTWFLRSDAPIFPVVIISVGLAVWIENTLGKLKNKKS